MKKIHAFFTKVKKVLFVALNKLITIKKTRQHLLT